MSRPTVFGAAVYVLASAVLPTAGEAACDLSAWQNCPDAMLVDPLERDETEVRAWFYSDQIVDLSDYRTSQYLQTEVPTGTSTPEWHTYEFDAIITPVEGKSHFWWLNRDTGERKSILFDAARRTYLLIPEGVPHFVDRRAAETDARVVELMLSKEVWTADDFIAHRNHVDEPFPPILPLE